MSRFTPQVRSQHPSHRHLKRTLRSQPFRAIIRLGSKTTTATAYPGKTASQLARVVEINTVQSINNSSNKLLMKRCFTRGNVKTAEWFQGQTRQELLNWANDRYPIISKSHHGSRGEGNAKHDNRESLERFLNTHNMGNYIFEKFYNFNREYRLHVTRNGCFYTCRKMLRDGTPDNQRWFRNDTNSVWIMDTNPQFNRPANWNAIVAECVKALNAVGLDIGGFDVKVQSGQDRRGRNRETTDFIIIESNSACSHGEVTAVKYREELNRLLDAKAANYVQTADERVLGRTTKAQKPQKRLVRR